MKNREIKFRAWDNKEKLMLNGLTLLELITTGLKSGMMAEALKKEEGEIADSLEDIVENLEFMQYTGLKDKNGKEIYEGDVVTTGVFQDLDGNMVERRFNIEWKEKEGMWGLGNKGKITTYILASGSQKMWEVIGNIYENPELINSHD